MLDMRDLVADFPDRGTRRLDHRACPAGTDTRRRLYITRKENGDVVAYCHNCGLGGIHRGGTSFRPPVLPEVEDESKEGSLDMSRFENNTYYWPKEMRMWLVNMRISLTTAQKYGITYDPESNRVVIPKVSADGELVQYQTRRLVADGSPKYMTRKVKSKFIHDPIGPGISRTCVIVEDMISAIRLSELDIDAVPLFTSTMTDETYLTLVEKYDRLLVWLDNDSVIVDRHAQDMVKKLNAMGATSGMVMHQTDPKHYSDESLQLAVSKFEEECKERENEKSDVSSD